MMNDMFKDAPDSLAMRLEYIVDRLNKQRSVLLATRQKLTIARNRLKSKKQIIEEQRAIILGLRRNSVS